MGKKRKSICISSSIANFRDKLKRRTNLPEGWGWGHTIFFGLYHPVDYLKLLLNVGRRTVFWCGSDILNLGRWRWLVRFIPAKHFCENEVEQKALILLGISAEVRPMIFEEYVPHKYVQSHNPQVYTAAHPERYVEYGVTTITRIAKRCPDVTFHIYGMEGESLKNVIFHGKIPSSQFNEEITQYQAALRLNEFDGFSEILAKSILSGGYPISRIPYPYLDSFTTDEELIWLLNNLKTKMTENPASLWWRQHLVDSLNTVLA